MSKRDTTARLDELLGSIASAFVSAKNNMDETSVELSSRYIKDDIMSGLSLPFFSISDVTLQLNFLIRDVEKKGEVYVIVDSSSLEKVPSHIISHLEIKLTPQPIRKLTREDGKTVYMSNPT